MRVDEFGCQEREARRRLSRARMSSRRGDFCPIPASESFGLLGPGLFLPFRTNLNLSPASHIRICYRTQNTRTCFVTVPVSRCLRYLLTNEHGGEADAAFATDVAVLLQGFAAYMASASRRMSVPELGARTLTVERRRRRNESCRDGGAGYTAVDYEGADEVLPFECVWVLEACVTVTMR